MKKLLIILFFLPVLTFGQTTKLLKVNGTSNPSNTGSFTFSGETMYISGVRAVYKNGDTLYIGLPSQPLTAFEASIRIGEDEGVDSPGAIRFWNNDAEVYLDGTGWLSLTSSAVYKTEVQTATKDTFNPGFTLEATSVIMLNGVPLSDAEWSGEGTQVLVLTTPAIQYDYLVIWK